MLTKKIHVGIVKQAPGGDERTLRFIASDESVDRDGDVITCDAWEVEPFQKNPVILFGHDYSKPPIAKAVRVEKDLRNKRLLIDARFPTTSELNPNGDASEHAKFTESIFQMYKLGIMSAVSVGFAAKKMEALDDMNPNVPEWARGHKITKAELFELSCVPVPSNSNALVEARGIKSIDPSVIDYIEKASSEMIDKSDKSEIPEEKSNTEFEHKEVTEPEQKDGRRLSAKTMEMIDAVENAVKEMDEAMTALKGCHEKSLKCLKELKDGIPGSEDDNDTTQEEETVESKKTWSDEDELTLVMEFDL